MNVLHIYHTHLLSNIDKIESVQRHFTKSFPGLKHYSYKERLNLLHILPLELRRLRADCIFLQKIRLGYRDISFDSLFTPQTMISSRRNLYVLLIMYYMCL